MSNLASVSLIIPCRNEEEFIGRCIDSVIANDYSEGNMEILVVDGNSMDRTGDIVRQYCERYPSVRLLHNPKGIIPTAMNIGIREAKGEIIMKIDAHSVYQKDYISKCVKCLNQYGADNVGGCVVAIPRDDKLMGRAIVNAISHPFGVGNSYFRVASGGARWSDTVYSGCYRREVFDKIGMYDEDIERSEDLLINSKLRKAGGKILLLPDIESHYYARSKFIDFIKHNFSNGLWTTYPIKIKKMFFSWRHLIPLIFVTSIAGLAVLSMFSSFFSKVFLLVVGSYLIVNVYFSMRIAFKNKNMLFLFLMPVVFTALHVSYGIGSICGLFKTK